MDLPVALVSTVEDQRFFELAATIIPIILFGSVLANALRPPDDNASTGLMHGLGAIFFSLYMAAMASAEMLAIAGAVGAAVPTGVRVFVAIALAVQIFLFGALLLVPWALRFYRGGQTHWVLGTAFGLLFFGVFLWGSVLFLEFAFEDSRNTEAFNEAVHRSDVADITYLQWSRAAIRAHSDHRISKLERHELAVLKRRRAEAWQSQMASGYSVPPIRYAR
jgi:hypothetical protein